jgi:hypothetical protein
MTLEIQFLTRDGFKRRGRGRGSEAVDGISSASVHTIDLIL